MGKFFDRILAAITWKNIVAAFKFLNVTDAQTGNLAPPKVLAWFLSIGICIAMFKIGTPEMDLGIFAGAIATLVAAFGVAYKLAMDGDKEEDYERDRADRRYEREQERRDRYYERINNRPYGVEDVAPEEPQDEPPQP